MTITRIAASAGVGVLQLEAYLVLSHHFPRGASFQISDLASQISSRMPRKILIGLGVDVDAVAGW